MPLTCGERWPTRSSLCFLVSSAVGEEHLSVDVQDLDEVRTGTFLLLDLLYGRGRGCDPGTPTVGRCFEQTADKGQRFRRYDLALGHLLAQTLAAR